jgi:hypothetical protein
MAWLVPALIPACQWPGTPADELDDEPPVIEVGTGTTLEEALSVLRAQLDTAAAGLDEAGSRSLARVEPISDRLLETRLPFAWISVESYSLEARLRQIQSRVDRIEALRTGGARREDVVAGIAELRAEVERLQDELTVGGVAMPTPVGVLLDSLDRSGPRQQPRPEG